MEVATLMTPNPAVVVESDPLSRAAELMKNGKFGLVPVVDEDGYPVGVVTPRDVCTKTFELARAPQDIRVRDAMRPDVVTIPAEATLREAQERMACAGLRRLVVVDATGALVGVLSLSDIASAFVGGGKGLSGNRHFEHTLARMRRARRDIVVTRDRSALPGFAGLDEIASGG